jgi:hypothetical protein
MPPGSNPKGTLMTIPETLRAEELARLFHETYERLAPVFGYKTRRESAVPWESVPEPNRNLMEAVATEILPVVEAPLRAELKRLEATVDYWIGEAKGFETDADEAEAENKRLRGRIAEYEGEPMLERLAHGDLAADPSQPA